VIIFLSALALIGLVIISTLRRALLKDEIRKLRETVALLHGQKETVEKHYEDMRSLAKDSIGIAIKRHLPERVASKVWESNYVAPIASNCPKCGVSVRFPPEDYPISCPACGGLIDPVLDNPPVLE